MTFQGHIEGGLELRLIEAGKSATCMICLELCGAQPSVK